MNSSRGSAVAEWEVCRIDGTSDTVRSVELSGRTDVAKDRQQQGFVVKDRRTIEVSRARKADRLHADGGDGCVVDRRINEKGSVGRIASNEVDPWVGSAWDTSLSIGGSTRKTIDGGSMLTKRRFAC